jgi:hypothetical protein
LEEINVVVSGAPLKSTVDEVTKLAPLTVKTKPVLPAEVEVGLRELVVGTEFIAVVTVNVCAFDVPPPGVGFTTVTLEVPTVVTSAAVIIAVSVELETKVVARDEPFHSTTEPDTKFVPLTVRVKSELPAEVEVGFSESLVGTGLLIVNVSTFEVPPPGVGFTTVTGRLPPVARSEARIFAVSVVLEMKLVVRLKPSH